MKNFTSMFFAFFGAPRRSRVNQAWHLLFIVAERCRHKNNPNQPSGVRQRSRPVVAQRGSQGRRAVAAAFWGIAAKVSQIGDREATRAFFGCSGLLDLRRMQRLPMDARP